MAARIESLLTARWFLHPQWAGNDLYCVSNLSGQLSLYRLRGGTGVPQPLLPPDVALPTPELLDGLPFAVYPEIGQIVVMIDRHGDEVYRPHVIPLDGDFPTPLLPDAFDNTRAHFMHADDQANTAYFSCELLDRPEQTAVAVDLNSGTAEVLATGTWGPWIVGVSDDQQRAALVESYTVGDTALFLWERSAGVRRLYGSRLDDRGALAEVPLTNFGHAEFTPGGGLLISTALFSDAGGAGYLKLDEPDALHEVAIHGLQHTGAGEFEGLEHRTGSAYTLTYNIDGVSWAYAAQFDEEALALQVTQVIAGSGALAGGIIKSHHYDRRGQRDALSFCSATMPVQMFTLRDSSLTAQTQERVLGIQPQLLSPGEDASFTSWDELRISARLYRPAPELGFSGPRPLVYYVHGGPQSQERPDFTWFSMPLIQFLTLNGFAVFVPNARGSTGYGLKYTKHVDRDWGGDDRLDHVHAMTQVLPNDPLIDVSRAGVVGRSYGGYMTLTLAGRHPELWSAAVDMFGPYDLLSFGERIPETWKPYFAKALGDPVDDRDFLIERSPSTHILNMTCPMLVIQGKNDPRVVETESRDLVEKLRAAGKSVDLLVFEDEGHDILKFANRVRCYNAITDFFSAQLGP